MIPDNNDSYSEPRLVDGGAEDAGRVAEVVLRPKTPMDFVEQNAVKTQLNLVLRAAKERGDAMGRVLLAGPPGPGKATLTMTIATGTNSSLRLTSGSVISRVGDLAAILSPPQKSDVLFIDEIHRLAHPAEETLYLAMEDFRVDVVVGGRSGAISIPLSLPQSTLAGATTRAGLLPASLRDWFGFTAHMEPYEAEDSSLIVKRSAALLGTCMTGEAAHEVAKHSRGTSRMANRLLWRVIDFALVHGNEEYDLEAVQATLKLFEVNEMEFDRLDRDMSYATAECLQGGPVGAGTLVVSAGEKKETVEEVMEPFLVWVGLLVRTQRGRVIIAKGYTHPSSSIPGGIRVGNTLFPSP